MDININKNKINILKRSNEEIMSERNNLNNKIRLIANLNNKKGRNIHLSNSNDNKKNIKIKLNMNKPKTLNEITLNNLERENTLLKKEIEIVKSNLIISDKKEQLNKKTLQQKKRMNKEKDNSYRNTMNLINEYKNREIDLTNKINNLENNFKKKENELNEEISLYKIELFNKDKVINELNTKIEELNKQILNLKKIINEKNRILLFLTKRSKSQRFKNINSINNIFNARTMVSSKSCGNIISRIKNDIKITDINSNIIIHNKAKKLKQILLNEEENKNNNENFKIIRKYSYMRKRIPNNNNKLLTSNIMQNSLNLDTLKKYHSRKNVENINNNSLNFENNLTTNANLNSNKKRKKIKKMNSDYNNIREIYINKTKKIKLSPSPTKSTNEKNFEKQNINEFNNYSFILNDLEKNKNQIKALKDIVKRKNLNYSNIIGNNTKKSKKIKTENFKGSYSKENNLIDIKKNYSSNYNNPSFSSNYSFHNNFLSYQK